MEFPFNFYAVGSFAAFAVSFASLPLWRRWSLRVGLVDNPGQRKIHATPIALAGGWAVLSGIVLPLVIGAIAALLGIIPGGDAIEEILRYGVTRRAGELAVILLGAFGMVLLGTLDDKYELSPSVKFGGQIFIAAAVALVGVRITIFVPSFLFSLVITVLWIVGVTNALNFLDNMNGLCTGLGVVGAWACGWSAAMQGQYLVAMLAFVAAGALLGFLPHNFPKATSFLGDAGSHLVGYLLAVLSILPHFYSKLQPSRWAVLSPLVVLAVPLLDMAWVVARRWGRGQAFYVGDTTHISHRLVQRGFSKTQAVVVIWLLAAITSTIALLFLQ
jgi:UDP-GlcNAc:undecaprenyl-phosphate GlcNAc-1-phosphate transferase